MALHIASTNAKPVLHVEVCCLRQSDVELHLHSVFLVDWVAPSLKDNELIIDQVQEEIRKWLYQSYIHLKINEKIDGYDSLHRALFIDSISVVDCTGRDVNRNAYQRLSDVELDIQVYQLQDDNDLPPPTWPQTPSEDGEVDASKFLRLTSLPSQSLVGTWESLYFDEPIPSSLLHYAARMMAIASKADLDTSSMNFNRLIMLYGPPGTGKTSLCRALTQKLSIRLGHHFTEACLVEVNSNSLHSKWFGESGKMVSKLFENIHSIAERPTKLVCILIDEVETLAGSRQKAVAGNEVGDALRATNQLLTALDKLRYKSNVMVFCTSNLLEAVDGAFLDRVDIKQYIGNPSEGATYDILRSCLNELARCGVLVPTTTDHENGAEKRELATNPFPSFLEVNVLLQDRPDTLGFQLWQIAQTCTGMSGRTLRRLPFLGLAMNTYSDPVLLIEGLEALSLAVDKELHGNSVSIV